MAFDELIWRQEQNLEIAVIEPILGIRLESSPSAIIGGLPELQFAIRRFVFDMKRKAVTSTFEYEENIGFAL